MLNINKDREGDIMSFESEQILRNIQKFIDQHGDQFNDIEDAVSHAVHMQNAGMLDFDENEESQALRILEEVSEMEDSEERMILLDQAHKLAPDNLDIYTVWALEHYNEFEAVSMIKYKADEYFKVNRQSIREQGYFAIEHRPYFRAQKYLLDFYKKELFIEEAEKIGKNILRYNPGDNLGARYSLMSIYVNSFQHKKARTFFKKEIAHRSDDQMLLYMAISLIFEGDFHFAHQLIEELADINPEIYFFFSDEKFNEFRIYGHLPQEYYVPNSKDSLTIAFYEIFYLFVQSSLLYHVFKGILMEINPDYFKYINDREKRIFSARINSRKLAGKGIFKNISSQYVQLLLFEDLETIEDFKEKTEAEVLAIEGIGKGTVKKLKENGVRFKND